MAVNTSERINQEGEGMFEIQGADFMITIFDDGPITVRVVDKNGASLQAFGKLNKGQKVQLSLFLDATSEG